MMYCLSALVFEGEGEKALWPTSAKHINHRDASRSSGGSSITQQVLNLVRA